MGLDCTLGCLRSFQSDRHHICLGCQLCTQPVLGVVSGCDNCINSLGCLLERIPNLCVSRIPGKAWRVSGETSNSGMGFYLIQLQMGGFGRCASSTRGWPVCQGPHSVALMLPRAWQLRCEPKSPVPVGALPRSSSRAPAMIPALSSGVGRAGRQMWRGGGRLL